MQDQLSAPLDEFKEREIEIINLMADGLSNREIAEQLFITKETVRWYNKQIYSKLGTSRRTEAIALARAMGLIADQPPSSDTTPPIQNNLPATTGPFIGRDADLDELKDLLQKPDIRLLTVIATGGMGKSRLVLELGHLIKGKYEHGVIFIDLTPVRNPDDIAKFAIKSLGVSIGTQTAQEILLNYCREKELLLIFDNFEHVLSGATLIADLLEVAPKVTIIITSRERLNLRAETAFYLQPISKQGDTLFLEIATMMHPNLQLDEDEQEVVNDIVELVGGSPLALILAATWLDTLTVAEISDEIKSNLDFLSAELGDMPERQRSIHAVIDPTWKHLSDKEQKAFMWASVFRGGFTRETFQQVTGASIRVLQTLLNRSLMSHGYGRRYGMHPLLRQYAREKLEEQGMLVDAKTAHLETFVNYAQSQSDRMYDGQHYLESLKNLEIEQDNLRAALDWSLSGYDTHKGAALTLTLCEFWATRSQRIEAIYYLEQAIQYNQEAALYERLGSFQERLGRPDDAKVNLQKAITLATGAKQLDVLAKAYRLKGTSLIAIDFDEAYKLFQQALAINKDLGLSRQIAHCYVHLGLYYKEIETKPLEALDYCQQAMTIYEKLGDLQGTSMVIYNMGLIYQQDGQNQRAKEYYQRSLAIKQEIGDRAGAARRLAVLAAMAIEDEEFDHAIASIAESRVICEEIGDLQRLGEVLCTEGFLHIIVGEYAQAQAVLERGLEIALNIKSYNYIVIFYAYIGLLFLIRKEVQKAKPYIINALLKDTTISRSPWVSILAYANLLWHENDFDACIAVTATLFRYRKDVGEGHVVNKYFLEPLIYRVQQHIEDDIWHDALDTASEKTIEQVFQSIVEEIQTK